MNKENKINTKKGVTLLELTIVMSIIILMSATILISLRGSRIQKELESSANEVVSIIRQAQNNALTGKQPSGSVAYGYGINIDTATNSEYKVFYNTAETDLTYDLTASTVVEATYKLKNNIEFFSDNSLYFKIPHGGIYDSITGSSLTSHATITITKASRNFNICIYPGGKIEAKADSC